MTHCKRFTLTSLFLFTMMTTSEAGKFRQAESKDLGSELGRAWILEPVGGTPLAVLVCLHGIQSNRDWWLPMGKELAAAGIAVWAFNRPGSGAPSPAGPADLTATTWDAQMAQVATRARERYGKIPAIAMGVSWGASATLVSTANPANGWAGAVLCNPAFVTRKDGAFTWTVVLSYSNPMTWFNGKAPLRLPLDDDDYTPNLATRKLSYFARENLKHTATRRFLTTTKKTKKAAMALLAKTMTPVLVLVGESDPLVPAAKLQAKLTQWREGNRKVKVEPVPCATHAAIIESERREYAQRIAQWVGSLSRQ